MAKKEQQTMFLMSCLSDNIFHTWLKNIKPDIKCWGYYRSVKSCLNKIKKQITTNKKDYRATINKTTSFYTGLDTIGSSDVDFIYYLSFIAGVANDLQENLKGELKKLVGTIEENMGKLYLYFEEKGYKDTWQTDLAIKHIDRFWMVFG